MILGKSGRSVSRALRYSSTRFLTPRSEESGSSCPVWKIGDNVSWSRQNEVEIDQCYYVKILINK